MQINDFKRDFARLNGACVTARVVLLREPLELYDLRSGETITAFGSLDDALAYVLNGHTLASYVRKWGGIPLPVKNGGGRSSSLDAWTGGFSHATGDGKGEMVPDLPARMNVTLSVNRTPEDTLRAFHTAHANDEIEHGVTVDEHGFVTSYVHGTNTSVAIWGREGEMVYHNHPSGGNFSDTDLLSTSMGAEKGVVASGKYGDYIFVKTQKFNASGFIKALKGAKLHGKDYNDAANKWLRANQKRYGYSYRFEKA